MMIELFGGVCIGLIWGWVAAQTTNWSRQALAKFAVFFGGAALISVQTYLYFQWLPVESFVGAAGLSFLIHELWLTALRRIQVRNPKLEVS